MDKIILNNLINKWHGSLKWLKSHQEDLTTEEWSAIEVLQDLWRNSTFGADMTREADEMIDVLKNSYQYHSNNREVITHSKEFTAVAKKFYTENSETFNEIRNALGKPRSASGSTLSHTSVRSEPDDQSLDPNILISYVRNWHRGIEYLLNHISELDTQELASLNSMVNDWEPKCSPEDMAKIKAAEDGFRNVSKLHSSNRDIITHVKYLTAASRKYNSSPRLHEAFARAILEYLHTLSSPPVQTENSCPIEITDILIGEHNNMGEWIPSTFYTDLTYLYLKISYKQTNPRAKKMDIGIRYIRPDGRIDGSTSSDGICSRYNDIKIYESGWFLTNGWGNTKGYSFIKGKWTIEVFIDGKRAKSVSFTMRDRPGTSRPSVSQPPLRVYDLKFIDVWQNLNSSFYSTEFQNDTKYIYPVVYYNTVRAGENVTLFYKIFNPDGRLLLTKDMTQYTWNGSFSTQEGKGVAKLGGFGSDRRTSFRKPGKYKVEIYYNNNIIYTGSFNIYATTSQQNTQSNKPVNTKKFNLLRWIIVLSIIAGAYFGGKYLYNMWTDRSATEMYAICDLDFCDSPYGNIINDDHPIRENDRILVYSDAGDGWVHIKGPDGKKGYVWKTDLISPDDKALLDIVTGTGGNPSLDVSYKRKALLSLLRSDKISQETVSSWRLNNSGQGLTPNTVNYSYLNNGAIGGTISFVLSNEDTGENKIAIYNLDGSFEPELAYFGNAPSGKEISKVTYSPRKGQYNVGYELPDIRVSQSKEADDTNPFVITDLKFVNVDAKNNLISNTVRDDAMFVAPKISYVTTVSPKSSVTLDIKIIDNHTGEMLRERKDTDESTYSSKFTVDPKQRGTVTLVGWGKSDKKYWKGNRDCQYEIYYHGRMIASGRFATPSRNQKQQIQTESTAVQNNEQYSQPEQQTRSRSETGSDNQQKTGQNVSNDKTDKTPATEDDVYRSVDQMPQFPGGEAELNKLISRNIRYPATAQERGISGRVVVQCTINKSGIVTDARVIRSCDPDLDREALRIVNVLPAFTPGKHNGQPVNVYYNIPINFQLTSRN